MQFIKRNKTGTPVGKTIPELAAIFGVSEEFVRILVDRGYDDEDKISEFLSDDISYFHDPFAITDMKRAVDRISYALAHNEKILICGDYDVDGTSAASILFLAFQKMGYQTPQIHIPNRFTEGYGLSDKLVSRLVMKKQFDLVITVDCGITSASLVEKLTNAGIDVIVTDHHEVPKEIPVCSAVLDLKRETEKYPFRELCGAGVAFKIVQALFGLSFALEFVDIAALATVCDVVPLVSENRLLVKLGLQKMNRNPSLGLSKLIEKTCGRETVKAYHLGFRIGPVFNACGRLSEAKYAVMLMISQNEKEAENLARWMVGQNEKRRAIEKEITELATKEAEKYPEKKCIIVAGENWHRGVIGIAASRLTDAFYKPSIVFSYDKNTGLYKGSCRSIPGISIYQALSFAKDFIQQFGGHEMAAGLTVAKKDYYLFCKTVQGYMNRVRDDIFDQKKFYDSVLPLSKVSEKLVSQIALLEPCGVKNPKASFALSHVTLENPKVIGKEKNHFRCLLSDKENAKISAIAFQQKPPQTLSGKTILFQPQINEYGGKKTLQLVIDTIEEEEKKDSGVSYFTREDDKPLSFLGVTKQKLSQFESAGIKSTSSLLKYLPKKYQDLREFTKVSDWENGKVYATVGTVISKSVFQNGNGFFLQCVNDSLEQFRVMFFGRNYAFRQFFNGESYFFSGTVSLSGVFLPSMAASFFSRDINQYKRIVPVYSKIRGMSDSYLLEKMDAALASSEPNDFLEQSIVEEYDLITQPLAKRYVHHPSDFSEIEKAKKRLLFDNLFSFAVGLEYARKDFEEKSTMRFVEKGLMESVQKSLPYTLTSDQQKAVDKIFEITSSDKKLQALLQGDVGCGKTIVALLSAVLAVENGYQAAIVAPTEVLAKQHFEDFSKILEPFSIHPLFLAGSTKAKEKKMVYQKLKDGSGQIVVGTHALLQDGIEFSKLGLLVIDEQHKFGVAQRNKLQNLKNSPHVITMSATPIPRTLSMALFGKHMEVITIYEKPAGRKPIITKQMTSDDDVNNFLLSEIKKGHQGYVVCPLIEESEKSSMKDLSSVQKTVEKIKKWFSKHPTVKISDISGKMKKADIDTEIQKFKNGETQILISTTIVEVGVNVPNATVMVLKNSERFGLAQAHQLRGRVGRGTAQGYLILQTAPGEPKAEILMKYHDGFDVSKADLAMRGAGDFLGTKQSGNNDSVLLMLANPEFFEQIEKTVSEIAKDTPRFQKYVENLMTYE